MPSKQALISVFEKNGVSEFAKSLVSSGFTILTTGGTFTKLRQDNIDVVQVNKLEKD